jgi:hypothetical protein
LFQLSTSRLSIASIVGFLLRLAVSSLLLAPPTAAVQNPHGVQLVNVKADTTKKLEPPSPIIAPPGSDIYQAQRGDSLPSVARKNLKRTKYLTSSELAEAIREANHNRQGVFLKSGEQIIIPGILEAPIVEKTVPVARDFEVRAIYLTGVMAGSDHGMRIIRHWREVGGNSVVFDIKDSDGIVNIAFDHPLAAGQRHYIPDLPKFTRFLHSQNMHAIARIAIFRDEHLVTTHPELAVKSQRTGQSWRENGKLVWTDPSNAKVQDYDIALAKFVARPESMKSSLTRALSRRGRPERRRVRLPNQPPQMAALGSDCQLPRSRLHPDPSDRRSAIAGCFRSDGMAASRRSVAYRTRHRSHGQAL